MGKLKPTSAFSAVSVIDKDASQRFYSDILGLEVTTDWMGLKVLLPGTTQTVYVYEKPDHVPASYTVLHLVVDNIDEGMAVLSDAGVVFEKYDNLPAPQDQKGVLRGLSANMGPDIAWFKDPSGNIFAILQEK